MIAQGEHQRLDFKFEISDARKIARSISAFSNTDGGTLLIGVKDNGMVAGVRSDEEIYMVEASAKMYCKPAVNFAAKQWYEGGKTVLEVQIPKLQQAICYAQTPEGKWRAFVRVNDNNYLANAVLLRVWKRKLTAAPTHMQYGEREKLLLDYLTHNAHISLNTFCTAARISRNTAETILVNLIMLDVLELFYTEINVLYRIK
ncbi:MAG: ATP-binding protein [Bacteroidota bacterium]